jgi:hypothetical protein
VMRAFDPQADCSRNAPGAGRGRETSSGAS